MDEYEATFEIDSKSDAYAVERLAESIYDSVREESRSIRDGSDDATAILERFGAICEATRQRGPGRLTVVYERHEEGFDD